jgi:hypothetical protein
MNTHILIARVAAVAAAFVLIGAPEARAGDSAHPGMYVEASPVGGGTVSFGCVDTIIGCIGGASYGGYRVSAEFGYHLTGRHDGLVVGVRQNFLFFSPGTQGITEARVGYDIPIPISKYELTIAPYGVAGVSYIFSSGSHAAFAFGVGAEGKFFFKDNLYAFAIPFELGGNIGTGYNGVVWQGGAGIGYAF